MSGHRQSLAFCTLTVHLKHHRCPTSNFMCASMWHRRCLTVYSKYASEAQLIQSIFLMVLNKIKMRNVQRTKWSCWSVVALNGCIDKGNVSIYFFSWWVPNPAKHTCLTVVQEQLGRMLWVQMHISQNSTWNVINFQTKFDFFEKQYPFSQAVNPTLCNVAIAMEILEFASKNIGLLLW